MNTVEVLEKILDGARLAVFHNLDPLKTEFLRDKEIPALHEAIAWVKVGEFLDRLKPWSLHSFAHGWILRHDPSGRTIEAPTITELAAKLEEK